MKNIKETNFIDNQKYNLEIRKINDIIDERYNGNMPIGNQIIFKKVPNLLIDIGVKQLPVLMSPSKIRNSVLTKNEATKLNFSISKNDNYHGIGKIGINKVLDNIFEPLLIIKETENKIIVFTDCFDYMERQIIIPIEINTKSYLNNNEINANVILSIHGRKNVSNFIENLLDRNAKIVYKKTQNFISNRKVPYPETTSSASTDNIP